jgi:hypothetical protein
MGGSGSQNVYIKEPNDKGSFGGSTKHELNCEDINFETNLVSPQLDVLKEYSAKDIFSLVLKDEKLVLITEDDEIIGTIFHKKVIDIIECKKNNYKFEGQIIAIDESKIEVQIYCV